jgi:ligand-binding sensor domain-containing protein
MSITRGTIRHFRVAARAIWIPLCVVFASPALATPPLSVQRYSLEEGLSQQAVQCHRAGRRRLHVVRHRGRLNRFDGYEFRQLRHDRGDEQSLPNGWISSLVASEDGLWIGTDGGGVVFRSVRPASSSPAALRDIADLQRVRTLARDRLGRLWIASRDAGVAIYDPRTRELQPHAPFAHRTALAVRQFGLQPSCSCATATRCRHRDRARRLRGQSRRLTRSRCRPSSPRRPAAARARADRVAGRHGLGRHRPASAATIRATSAGACITGRGNSSLPDNRVQSLLVDSQSRLWVGTIHGLSWFDSRDRTFRQLSARSRRAAFAAGRLHRVLVRGPRRLAVDRHQDRRLAKWNPRTWSFGHFRASAEEGFTDRNITSFAEDKLGRLWIGTFGSGINLLDRTSGRVTPVRHVNGVRGSLSDERVMAMLEGSDGDVWVGTMGGGLNRFDPRTLKAEVFTNDPAVPTSLGAAGVMSLLEVDKQLWVGTFGGGLSRFDARTRRSRTCGRGPKTACTCRMDA